MRLYRSGADRFCGWDTLISNTTPKLDWETDDHEVVLKNMRVKHPSKDCHYRYDVHLDMEDIGLIIRQIAERATGSSGPMIKAELRPYAADLFALLACTSGIVKSDKENEAA